MTRAARMRYLGFVFLLFCTRATAQWAGNVDPIRKFRLKSYEGYVKINLESQNEQRTSNGVTSQHEFSYLEPLVGFDFRGYVYHPNLMNFDFNPELGGDLQSGRLDQKDRARWNGSMLQHYNFRMDFLREKPFATSFFSEQGRSQRDLDFFSRSRVDSTRLGGHTGYSTGKYSLSLDALRTSETITGSQGRDSDYSGNTVTLVLDRNGGNSHKTDFTYIYNDFSRLERGLSALMQGSAQSAELQDVIHLGKDDRLTINSNGLYSHLEGDNRPTSSLLWREIANYRLRPNLTADFDANFSEYRSQVTDTTSRSERASLRHKLFESLTSTLMLQQSNQAIHSTEADISEKSEGLSLAEGYCKQLPLKSLLTFTGSWRLDRVKRKTVGQQFQVTDESVTLQDNKPAFLSQLNVLAMGRVTSDIGSAYLETLDYRVIWHGTTVEIRRVAGGNIPDGSRVLVSYTAAALPSDAYSTFMQSYYVRLDLFNGVVGLFGRANQIHNSGGQSVMLRELAERGYGAEVRWHWLTVGSERDVQHSNYSPFSSRRFYQSAAIELGLGSLLTLDLEEGTTDYPDRLLTRKGISAIGRYRRQFNSNFSWQLEGGIMRERGQAINQDRKLARTAITYSYGQLTLNISYEYENEVLVGELHRLHRFLLQARRQL